MGKSWCEKTAAVNPNFQFTAKLFQGFTHNLLMYNDFIESTKGQRLAYRKRKKRVSEFWS